VERGTIRTGFTLGYELEVKMPHLSSNEVSVQRVYNVRRGHNGNI
jgi:hypothetical protein